MAGLFTVPKRATESLKGQGDQPFAVGQWVGTIEEIRIKDELPSNAEGEPFAGYSGTDGEEVSLQLGDISPLDDQADVGNRKYFVDITTRDGHRLVESVDATARNVDYWKLQKSQSVVANLAHALGFTEVIGEDVEVSDDFLDVLRSGDLKGRKVGFVIYHRNGKKGADGKRAIYDGIDTFFDVG